MSNWGNRFISEIEKINVRDEKIIVWSVGGAGFILKNKDDTIFIDPFFGSPPQLSHDLEGFPLLRMIPIPIDPSAIKKANLVLITNDHLDHCHTKTLSTIHSNTNSIFLGPEPIASRLLNLGFNKERIKEVMPNDELKINDIKISVLESNDEIMEEAVMYVIQCNGVTFFHSGDSRYFEGFLKAGERWNIDVAFLSTAKNPPGRQMYLTPYDVLRAARDLKTKMLIPMHWDLWKRTCMAPSIIKFLAKTIFPQVRVTILHLGDNLVFPDVLDQNNGID